MSVNVTFIGLGVMGYPMAGHLARAGHKVTVFNRTVSKARDWTQEYDGKACDTIAEAVAEADFVMTCVGADPDLRAVYLNENGIIANAPTHAILIDHTTVSAEVTDVVAKAAHDRGQDFMDAPVSGGQQGAENGKLTIMCGASQEAFDRAKPLLDCYGKAVTRMGEAGKGQLTKMVNQIAIAGLVQGLSECLYFAEQSGLDQEQVIDVISQGAAQSWQMENRSPTMIEGKYDHGFAVNWMRKDLDICLTEARHRGITLPVTALVDQFYADVQAMGGGRWDTSSLLARLRKLGNLE
ncbi:NAD(P)-dependent oxidoreductase [Marinobacter nanhaiticus D15-8W]|uniref:NAD(P)-dependent oxidoreductase n=1 Tax=Marinobacter nanhaiticus D15-8W TaxID=626887 RepID=N6WS25_9GAMM|nr:NAD(P)-dependent oxidoreductase [Marinobacter nanhaiticus D15-8W]BES71201.1 NAD(P)-dependent oxidoreductase [Marinobacter nanhaiticus D15-8W]